MRTRLARTYDQVAASARSDDAFRRRLMANPAGVLREHGFEVPRGTEVRLVEGLAEPEILAGLWMLPLPPGPPSDELSDSQLDRVAGGTTKKVWEYIRKNGLQDKAKRT